MFTTGPPRGPPFRVPCAPARASPGLRARAHPKRSVITRGTVVDYPVNERSCGTPFPELLAPICIRYGAGYRSLWSLSVCATGPICMRPYG
jgi:hypothetical protein